jgi:hypothetical protein
MGGVNFIAPPIVNFIRTTKISIDMKSCNCKCKGDVKSTADFDAKSQYSAPEDKYRGATIDSADKNKVDSKLVKEDVADLNNNPEADDM